MSIISKFLLGCALLVFPFVSALGVDTGVLVTRPAFKEHRDFEQMKSQRIIRVLTTQNMTNFFIDKGTPRGFEYELLVEYEKFLNQGITSKDLQIHVVVIPIAFEDLLPSLIDGYGDVVAAGLTVTPARQAEVMFSEPYLKDVTEVIVTSGKVTGLKSLNDLAGRTVHLPFGSSFAQHLEAFNKRLTDRGLTPSIISYLPSVLDTEDALEMTNAGIIDITVADRHVAMLWGEVLPNLQVHSHLELNREGRIAWAVRKNNPMLLANIDAFMKDHKKGTLLGNIYFKRYFENTKWVSNPITEEKQAKIRELRNYFETYSEKYGFDWLLMAAQGFQESRLNQSTKSGAGAIGIMQLLPSTAKDMGFPDVSGAEENIHAGIKYMAYLRRRFFDEPEITDAAKVDFCLAAYNAGPGRVQRWRKKAQQQGLDPNRWFDNVEWIALDEIGRETVRYVANINKYFVAYRLMYNWRLLREGVKEEMASGKESTR